MNPLVVVVAVVFAAAAVVIVWKIVIGPSILDRAVAADVLLTEVLCVMGTDMVLNHTTRTLPAMIVVAAVGVFGSISVSRFVARRDRS